MKREPLIVIPHLGGEDFDQALVNYCLKEFKKKKPWYESGKEHESTSSTSYSM